MIKYGRETEGMKRYDMSRSKFRTWAKEASAVIHIGRMIRYDFSVLDTDMDRRRVNESANLKQDQFINKQTETTG